MVEFGLERSLLSFILGIDGMLLCPHFCVATLHANPACCHPEFEYTNMP